MSIQRCENCDKHIDTDYDAEHFDVCGKEEQDTQKQRDALREDGVNSNKRRRIVYIHYLDSGIIDEQASVLSYVHNMIAVGVLIVENEREVVIAREFDRNENNWRGQLAIPREVITHITVLGEYDQNFPDAVYAKQP